uniref:Cell envelope-related transcriptional attenuator domain-containing protein n=1 Tax=Thermosporothrix sp. COM3 TaxID=2490863 RepID=A0A455SND8_9CHLR|nr:hypothetical protein KTC_32400 [Thermosporothrix sp. COM3]
MSDKYQYGSDDPTVRSFSQEHHQNQGKLVLGGGAQGAQKRQPYQYPPQAPGHDYAPPVQQSHVRQSPGGPVYTPPASAQRPGPSPRNQPPKKGRIRRIGCLSLLVILAVLIIASLFVVPRVLAFGSAISTKAPLTTETGFMSTGDRVNLLVMGYGGGDHDGANLMDSLVTISMIPSTQHTSLVSVPRDLWVQVPPQSGQYGKINTVYQVGSNNGKDRVAGANMAAQKISEITGLDVKYWMMVDFNGFRKLIDAVGGVDINVPEGFTANYPKNDDPNIDASWIKVTFKKGYQHMNGETAIRYSRARYVLDNPAEGTDFARSVRQQTVIKATLAKLKSASTWPNFYGAMDALEKSVYTNMSLTDLGLFTMKMDMNDPKTARIGLSTQNVLAEGTADDGAYILTARENNWDLVKQYVQDQLYK